jgi:flagella basal body P-ring formation protein FlgA
MINAGHIAFQIAVAMVVALATPTPTPSSSSLPSSSVLRQALERALAAPGARLDSVVEERSAARSNDCRAVTAEVTRPIDGSGRVALKITGRSLHGQSCDGWTWVRVRVVAPVMVTARAVREGERVAGATVSEERELRAGHEPATVGPASVAVRAIAAGQMIEASQISEPTLRAGEAVKVLVVSGAVAIEQSGRAVPCTRGRSCAMLASGRRVEGDLVDGRLVVESP